MSDIKWTEIPVTAPEVHLESLEESMAHQALKRLYVEVGHSNSHKLESIRISKHKGCEGSPVMIATGSIRVYFVGRSTIKDIPGGE
jgi:hypothetical protein